MAKNTARLAALATAGVLALGLASCSGGGSGKASNSIIAQSTTVTAQATETVTEQATTTITATTTQSAPQSTPIASPPSSLTTEDEFLSTVRRDVASAASWDDQFILVESNDICDKYNNRGATWQELMAEWTAPGYSYRLTQHEANAFITDALAGCNLPEVATATP